MHDDTRGWIKKTIDACRILMGKPLEEVCGLRR
jgi:hypothetical protein